MSSPSSAVRAWFGADIDAVIDDAGVGQVVLVQGGPDFAAQLDLVRRADHVLRTQAQGWMRPAEGSLGPTTLPLNDGSELALVPYGLGAVAEPGVPTILRVCDEHDFSAYLRDADDAWRTGDFTEVVTEPEWAVADLRALGGPDLRGGPDARLLVGADGQVRTAPFGLPIGTPASSLEALRARWQELDRRAGLIGGAELGAVLDERDRVEALRERPWLARYAVASSMLRRARRVGLGAKRVVGFGDGSAVADPETTWAPVQLCDSAGRAVRTVDPSRPWPEPDSNRS